MAPRQIPFPVRLLVVATVCNLALLAGLGWYIRSSARAIASLQSQEVQTLERMGAARRASDNRIAAARMRLATGDGWWRVSHRDLQSDWRSALADLQRLAPNEFRTEAGRQLAESGERLFRLEEQALDLAKQGNTSAGAALLLTEPYVRNQETFSRSAEQITGWLRDRLHL